MARLLVVTGGGKGIGRAVAERFAAGDDEVVSVGRPPGDGVDQVCDVSDEEQVVALFGRLGAVEVLVNNAGVAESAPFVRTTLEQWRRHLGVNATGAFLCTRAVLPGMLERDRGRVIAVPSVAAKAGSPYIAAYTASKHAAVGLMRAVASEVAGTGVTVNAVCPTYVRTPMTERTLVRISERTGRSGDEALAALTAPIAIGGCSSRRVAAAVWYLAPDEAAAMNEQTLVLDGGGLQS